MLLNCLPHILVKAISWSLGCNCIRLNAVCEMERPRISRWLTAWLLPRLYFVWYGQHGNRLRKWYISKGHILEVHFGIRMPAINRVILPNLHLSLIISWVCCCNATVSGPVLCHFTNVVCLCSWGPRNMPLICCMIGPGGWNNRSFRVICWTPLSLWEPHNDWSILNACAFVCH